MHPFILPFHTEKKKQAHCLTSPKPPAGKWPGWGRRASLNSIAQEHCPKNSHFFERLLCMSTNLLVRNQTDLTFSQAPKAYAPRSQPVLVLQVTAFMYPPSPYHSTSSQGKPRLNLRLWQLLSPSCSLSLPTQLLVIASSSPHTPESPQLRLSLPKLPQALQTPAGQN